MYIYCISIDMTPNDDILFNRWVKQDPDIHSTKKHQHGIW